MMTKQWEWEIETGSGDYILNVDGRERGRIPKPIEKQTDFNRLGGSQMGVEDIKQLFEKLLGLSDTTVRP